MGPPWKEREIRLGVDKTIWMERRIKKGAQKQQLESRKAFDMAHSPYLKLELISTKTGLLLSIIIIEK